MPFPLRSRPPRSARFLKPQLLVIFLFFAAALSTHAENIKDIHPTSYVTDLANVINADSKTRLENLCLDLQQKTGAQMAIVTVRSLENETVEQYGNELYKQLGVGDKKESRGVLVLVAPTERKYWTEVGYGLEPVINDARAGDAGRLMRSYFIQGNYSAGIEAAAWQLAKYIADDRGVTLSGAPPARPVRAADNNRSFPIFPIIFFIFVIISIIRAIAGSGRGGRGGRPGSGWWIGPMIGGMLSGGGGGGGFGGSSGGGGGGFGGFGGGSSGGGGAGGSW
jgi:uncharacterized protein